MRVLAEISTGPDADPRPGSLRRCELDAYEAVLDELGAARVVLVTGTASTRCALGLAAAAVADGRAVALVECDLVSPALAGALGLAPAPGLREYLAREAEAQWILQPLVLAGPASAGAREPLVCIAAGGPHPEGWAGLLASPSFAHATVRLREAYDFVVIDGPPLGRRPEPLVHVAAHADAIVAGTASDGAAGSSANGLRRDLGMLPAKLAGLVVFS